MKLTSHDRSIMATVQSQPEFTPFAATRFIAHGESGELFVPSSAHTLDGFRRWALSEEFPDRGRITFAAGELIIDMSPELYETHNCIKSEVSAVIYLRVKRLKLGRFFSDRFLLSNPGAGISTEPDATYVSHASLRSGRCQIVRSNRPGVSDELVGSPDWVLEILSPSSLRKDKKLLHEAYFRAGVGEYWLINALGDDIDFQMLVPGKTSYVPINPGDSWLESPTFGCSFRLTREKDEDDLWDYTLNVKEN